MSHYLFVCNLLVVLYFAPVCVVVKHSLFEDELVKVAAYQTAFYVVCNSDTGILPALFAISAVVPQGHCRDADRNISVVFLVSYT